MSEHDTGVRCKACKVGTIIGVVESVRNTPLAQIPVGPSGAGCYDIVVIFHCSHCQCVVRYPPGKPNAAGEILQDIEDEKNRKQLEASRSPEAIAAFREMMKEKFPHLKPRT